MKLTATPAGTPKLGIRTVNLPISNTGCRAFGTNGPQQRAFKQKGLAEDIGTDLFLSRPRASCSRNRASGAVDPV